MTGPEPRDGPQPAPTSEEEQASRQPNPANAPDEPHAHREHPDDPRWDKSEWE